MITVSGGFKRAANKPMSIKDLCKLAKEGFGIISRAQPSACGRVAFQVA